MKHIQLLGIVIVSNLLYSCFPEPLEIDVPFHEPKLVVASQFLSDTGVIVTVTRSFSALSDNYKPEKINLDFIARVFALNALVTIEHEGTTDTLAYLGPGLYGKFSTHFSVNELCYLHIFDSATEMSVESQAVFLQKVNFDTVYALVEITPSDTIATLYYGFYDIPGLNYYMTTYYKLEEDDNPLILDDLFENDLFSGIFENPDDLANLNSMLNSLGKIGNVGLGTKLYCDTAFHSVYLADSFVVRHSDLQDSLAVAMANISPEYHYYLYLRSKAGTLYSQIMSEPINMNTNIDDGYGMFTTHALDVRYIFLTDYINIQKNLFPLKNPHKVRHR